MDSSLRRSRAADSSTDNGDDDGDGDDDGGDGDDDGGDDGRIFPEHPSPILHAPRDIISRKGKSLTPIGIVLIISFYIFWQIPVKLIQSNRF